MKCQLGPKNVTNQVLQILHYFNSILEKVKHLFEELQDQTSTSEHLMKSHTTSSFHYLKEDTLGESISQNQLQCEEKLEEIEMSATQLSSEHFMECHATSSKQALESEGFSSAKGQKISISKEALGKVLHKFIANNLINIISFIYILEKGKHLFEELQEQPSTSENLIFSPKSDSKEVVEKNN